MSTYGVDLSTRCFIMSKVYVIMLKFGSSCLRVTCLDDMSLCQTHLSIRPHHVACVNIREQHHAVEQDDILGQSDTYGRYTSRLRVVDIKLTKKRTDDIQCCS